MKELSCGHIESETVATHVIHRFRFWYVKTASTNDNAQLHFVMHLRPITDELQSDDIMERFFFNISIALLLSDLHLLTFFDKTGWRSEEYDWFCWNVKCLGFRQTPAKVHAHSSAATCQQELY